MKTPLSKILSAIIVLLLGFIVWFVCMPGGTQPGTEAGQRTKSGAAGERTASGGPTTSGGTSASGGPMLSRPGARKGEEAPPPRPFARALPVGEKVNSSGVAATFKASDYHEVSYPDGRPRYDGEEVLAYVTVPSAKIAGAYTVNQAGEYPRVYTQPKERVEVTMQFSQSEPRTAVAVVVQDGGRLENGSVSQMVRLDEHRRIGFGFKVSSNVGIHRVTVTTSGGQARVLNFWAGAPNPVRDDVAAK